jgi:dienelactone hydrolase
MRKGDIAFPPNRRDLRRTENDMKLSLLAAAAALLACIAGCHARPETLQHRVELLAPYAQYYAPQHAGPAPLVILVSGCGGLVGIDGPNLIMNKYAESAARAGAYAIVVDSFRPRGIDRQTAISKVCTGLRLRGTERAGDILAAEALARAHWKRTFPGTVLAGWSHGGWSVMNLLTVRPDAPWIGNLRIGDDRSALRPSAVALFYPFCGFPNKARRRPWTFEGPLLLITAQLDTRMGPAKECLHVIDHARGSLAGVEAVDFPGMTHAFDERVQSPNSRFIYNAAAAERARELFADFIAQQVARLRAPSG